ncbi:MAG: hypothetical protein E7538_05525 [Ruminococcaceae bacterium]|nr:hypothetical protein [Oscillospiraceae bacterium]
MRIFLENKSSKTLFINLNGQSITLNPFAEGTAEADCGRVSLSLTTEDNYSSEEHAEKMGYYCFHRFITVSQYDFTAEKDFSLELYVETKKGDHFESYQRVSPYCRGITLPEPIYTLKNEAEIKENFKANEALEAKAEKRADLIVKADNIGTIISNAVMIILSIGIAALVFIAIYQNFSLKTAVITLAVIGLMLFLISKAIQKLINRIGKTADKFFSSRLFDKAVDKANEKFEANYVYCKDMPTELFKDRSSFFDPNYISAVFKYSNKNI